VESNIFTFSEESALCTLMLGMAWNGSQDLTGWYGFFDIFVWSFLYGNNIAQKRF
jgi:hypothetical protein